MVIAHCGDYREDRSSRHPEFFCYTRSTEMPNASQVVRFGLFEVDLTEGTLLKNGRKIKLQDQPFRLLVMLLEQPGGTVTRERLKEALWSADTFVDFDHNLNAAVPSSVRFWTTQPRILDLWRRWPGEAIALSRRWNNRSESRRRLRDAGGCRLR